MGLDYIKGIAIILMVYGHSTYVGSLSSVQNHKIAFPIKSVLPYLLLIGLIYWTYTPKDIRSLFFVQASLVASIFFVVISVAEIERFKKVATVAAFVGKNTLIILVMHIFFLNVFKVFAGRVLAFENTGLLYAVLATSLTVILSIVSAKIFDLMKVSRFIFSKKHIYQSF